MMPSNQLRREENGNAVIEVALIVPVLILLLLGVMDFGILLNQALRVADSARSAAEGATIRAHATDPIAVAAEGNLSALGIPGYTITSVNYCTCANGLGTASCSSHSSCGAYGTPNQYIKVTASANLPLLFALKGLPATYPVKYVVIARTAWTGTN